MTHLDNLLKQVPDLASRRILDVGSGRGGFLVDAARRGWNAVGVEINPKAIARAHERAVSAGVTIDAREGSVEQLPFPDYSFDFANVCEVLEHVPDPDTALAEVSRVLSPRGVAYVSIPNRFGFFDPHYHVLLVNWLPRAWSLSFLRLLGKEKDLSQSRSGRQLLTEMHYMTQDEFRRICLYHGFHFTDSRELKLKRASLGLLIPFYRLYAFLFVPTFHGIAAKYPSLSNDALFRGDLQYVPHGRYDVYPHKDIPRIIVPRNDQGARLFVSRLLPPFSYSEPLVVGEGNDALVRFVSERWQAFGKEGVCDVSSLSFTKFCQRVAAPHTKILFLVTYRNEPLCVLKMMRSDSYNAKLQAEKKAQEHAPNITPFRAPRVYCDGVVDGRYVYAEEVLKNTRLLSRERAWDIERNIIEFSRAFSTRGTISASDVADILSVLPEEETRAHTLLEHLRRSEETLTLGETHGDVGSTNILENGETLYVIDWERANEEPFWLLDGVSFSARLRRISDLADWRARARDTFLRYAVVSASYADALFCLRAILGVLRKRHPGLYQAVLSRLGRL